MRGQMQRLDESAGIGLTKMIVAFVWVGALKRLSIFAVIHTLATVSWILS